MSFHPSFACFKRIMIFVLTFVCFIILHCNLGPLRSHIMHINLIHGIFLARFANKLIRFLLLRLFRYSHLLHAADSNAFIYFLWMVILIVNRHTLFHWCPKLFNLLLNLLDLLKILQPPLIDIIILTRPRSSFLIRCLRIIIMSTYISIRFPHSTARSLNLLLIFHLIWSIEIDLYLFGASLIYFQC